METSKLYGQESLPDGWAGWGKRSAAIDGDTILLGAAQPNGVGNGEVYVFQKSGTDWNQVATLTADDGKNGDLFGSSVAIDGDRAVVTASDIGTAYVFQRTVTGWLQTDKITAFDGVTQSQLDGEVALDGDTLIIGSPHDTDKGHFTGAAYIFEYDGTDWQQAERLIASDQAAADGHGFAVDIDGGTALVGAVDKGNFEGAVYVYEKTPTGWQEVEKLTANEPLGDKGGFGSAIALDGDRAVIGRFRSDEAGNKSGSAYVYEKSLAGWGEVEKLTALDAGIGDQFGNSVDLEGDTVVIGAFLDDEDENNVGSAYVYEFDGTDWNESDKLTLSTAATGDLLGYSVAIDSQTIVVSKLGDDQLGNNTGAAHVYTRTIPEPNTLLLSLLGMTSLVLDRRRTFSQD